MPSRPRAALVALCAVALPWACTEATPKPEAVPTKAAPAKAEVDLHERSDTRGQPPEIAPTTAVTPPLEVAVPTTARLWNFDGGMVRALAKGFSPLQTGEPTDSPTIWAIALDDGAPSGNQTFGVISSVGKNKTYNVALVDGSSYRDFEASVMLRGTGGTNTRAGGLVFRAKGVNDHYVARWNPVEANFRIYALLGGARVDIASAPLELPEDEWHQLRVVVQGDTIECFMDDVSIVKATDKALPEAGMIGLWTKGDATTLFDDLMVDDRGGAPK